MIRFPENKNPNWLLILAIGCASSFLMPIAWRFNHLPTIVALLMMTACFLTYTCWARWQNLETERKWILENDISEISASVAKKKLESWQPNEARIVLHHDRKLLSFLIFNPRMLFIDQTGNIFSVRWRFAPQIYSILTRAHRCGFSIIDSSGSTIRA